MNVRQFLGTSVFSLVVAGSAFATPLPSHHPAHTAPVNTMPMPKPLPGAAAALARASAAPQTDVLTYHYDNNRTGWNPNETVLTQANVASSNFGLLTTLAVDGNVFAQPLEVSGIKMADGSTHDLLIIATGHDSVYAYDAHNYALLWHVSLGTPQSTNDVGCGDVQPEYGISSTPVIVRSGTNAAVIYVVAATENTHLAFQTKLHALSAATGADKVPPVVVAPSGTLSDGSSVAFDPQNQWNRSSLALFKNTIYVAIGSHCDNNAGSISGWLASYSTSLVPGPAFHTIESSGGTELASIWMTGFAPAIDASGNIFVVTGNGDYNAPDKDWGESALKLPPSLKAPTGRFTDSGYNKLNRSDQDFGSGGIMLLPAVTGQSAPPLAFARGKSGTFFLLNQNALGGIAQNNAEALQSGAIGGGVWGGPAYFNGPNGPTIFTQGNGDVLKGGSVNVGATPTVNFNLLGTTGAGYGGSLPIVSSNGASAGTGIVWLIRRSSPISFEAYNAEKLGAPIFTSTVGTWSNPSNNNPFLTPMEANGRVYVPGYLLVQVYGLK